MIDAISSLLEKYRQKGLLIDTNLLLLFVIGKHKKSLIGNFKRVQQFTIEDFELICQFVSYFEKVVVTPNILTEVNSFLNQLPEHEKQEQYKILAELIQVFNERYSESKKIAHSANFKKYGLTDAEIAESSLTKNHLILTDDFRLSGSLQAGGIDVINFNNVRMYNWKK